MIVKATTYSFIRFLAVSFCLRAFNLIQLTNSFRRLKQIIEIYELSKSFTIQIKFVQLKAPSKIDCHVKAH